MRIELAIDEKLDIVPAEGATLKFDTTTDGYIITSVILPPEPPLDPDNWMPNGKFFVDGIPSLMYWHQANDYMNVHKPRPNSPSGTHYLQADRDWNGTDIWPAENPTIDFAWTKTRAALPKHDRLMFGWEELHHMFAGSAKILVYSFSAFGEELLLFARPLQSAAITSKDTPPTVVSFDIPVPPGGYSTYIVEVEVTLADNRDGLLIGDFRLRGD